ncbi:MAG: hypothetical protein KDA45_02355 [Planctomycetales bacterium]|nr:hypothetical protein [Planctomycetales bacterium]
MSTARLPPSFFVFAPGTARRPARSVGGVLLWLAFVSPSLGQGKPQAAEEAMQVVVRRLADPAIADPQLQLLSNYAHVNIALARRACTLTAAQEQDLARIDVAWIEKEVAQAVEIPVQRQLAAGIARFLGARQVVQQRQRQQPHEVNRQVKTAIDQHIVSLLSDEQKVLYEQQVEARAKFRRQALAGVLVSALDRRLFLTAEQRTTLQTAIAQWLTQDLYWTFYYQNEGYIPDIPRTLLAQALDAEQLDALQGLQTWNYETAQMEMQMMGQAAPVVIEY